MAYQLTFTDLFVCNKPLSSVTRQPIEISPRIWRIAKANKLDLECDDKLCPKNVKSEELYLVNLLNFFILEST